MLILRNLMTISTGVLIALNYGTSINAQTVTPSVESSELLHPSLTNQPKVSDMQNMALDPPTPDSKPSSQNTGETKPPSQPVPENVNPNANPLLFPTKPSEVNITNVQSVTLEQALELAFKNNIATVGGSSSGITTTASGLRQARLDLEKAQARLNEAQAALYPNLGTQVDFDRVNSADVKKNNQLRLQQGARSRDLSNENSTNVSGRVEVSYNVYTGGQRSATIQQAQEQVRLAELQVEVISEQLRFEVTDAYYKLQQADAQVAIGQAAVEDASVSLRDARLLEQAGLGTRFSVLQAEVDLAKANQQLTQYIANQRVARRQLAEILNLGQKVELTAADEIREAGTWNLSLEDSIILAYKNRAELEQKLLQKDVAQQQSYIALAQIKPQVSVFANYNFLDNFDDTLSAADGYVLGTRLTWNFFDGGKAYSQAEQAYRDMDLANTEFARLRNQFRQQVESSYYNLIANKENIQTAAKNVETATESLRLARLRFQAGVGTQTDVINSQRDLTQARSDYLSAIVQYNQSLNALQRSVSNLPDNRLFKVH